MRGNIERTIVNHDSRGESTSSMWLLGRCAVLGICALPSHLTKHLEGALQELDAMFDAVKF